MNLNMIVQFRHGNHIHSISIPYNYLHIYPECIAIRRHDHTRIARNKYQITIMRRDFIRAVPEEEIQ